MLELAAQDAAAGAGQWGRSGAALALQPLCFPDLLSARKEPVSNQLRGKQVKTKSIQACVVEAVPVPAPAQPLMLEAFSQNKK